MTLANYLYALIYSGVFSREAWQMWGEQLVKNANYDKNTEWVFELVFSSNREKAFNSIPDRMNDENYLNYNDYVLTEIIQGYYFFQYREGVLSVYDLLIKSGDVADAGGDSTDCEFFYNLLNQIDTKPDIVSDNVFNKVINDYFTPLYEVALEQKRQLESCTLEDLIIEND